MRLYRKLRKKLGIDRIREYMYFPVVFIGLIGTVYSFSVGHYGEGIIILILTLDLLYE